LRILTWREKLQPFIAVELAIVALAFTATVVYAAPPPPVISLLKQADGTVFAAWAYGDEWYSGVETVDGYTILFDEWAQNWVYAWKGPDGSLNRSSLVVGKDRPVGIPKHLRPAPELIASRRPAFLAQRGRPVRGGNIGAQPMLVLLVDFTDRSPVDTTAGYWREKIFGNENSVAHYYKEVSYNKFDFSQAAENHGIPDDGIVGWLHMPYNHPNSGWMPGIADQQLAKDAILAADTYVDFAAFDGNDDDYISRDELRLVLVVAGYEAGYYQAGAPACTPCIRGTAWGLDGIVSPPVVDGKTVASWSGGGGYTQFGEWHCHSLDTPGHSATLGIMVHEIGHDLDWPDLYDTDYSSKGVGYWSVMSYGMWLYTGSYLGDCPSHPDAWSKWYQGWLTPTEVSGLVEGASIPQVETSPMAYQLLDNPGGVDWDFYDCSGTGEYFLVENRQRAGYDGGLPGCGLLIWHIDETRPYDNWANADETRKLVDLEEADGRNDLDHNANWGDNGDSYPGDSNNRTFNDASTPNSYLYIGTPSKVSVTNISDAGETMTADLGVRTVAYQLFLPLMMKNY
jgi:M6 family metalloprotease-like protein